VNPILIAAIIQEAPAIMASIIAICQRHGLADDAARMTAALAASDADADTLIAHAKAALGL
jgi:hypothetical protein